MPLIFHRVLLSSLLFAVACFVAQRETIAAPDLAKPPPPSFMQFPTAYGLGRISNLPKDLILDLNPPAKRFWGQARGRVRIPVDAHFYFDPNGAISEEPTYLRQFPPNSLQSIRMVGLDVNDNLLAEVSKLSGLKRIDLNETDLTDDGLNYFSNLTHIELLSIPKTLIKGPGLVHLAALKGLRYINLSGNGLEPGSTKYLTDFPVLASLCLTHCLLTDKDLEEIARAKHLSELSIAFNNGITDSGIKSLTALKYLTFLDVDETAVTARGLLVFKGRPMFAIRLPARCNNKKDLTMLHQAFPKTALYFSDRGKGDAVEFFDPSHKIVR